MMTDNYTTVLHRLQAKVNALESIRVAFYVVYDSAFPGRALLQELTRDPRFDVYIVLVPDTMRGAENMILQIRKSKESLQDIGVPIIAGYDEDKAQYIDVSAYMDIVCFSNPYDEITHKIFGVNYLQGKSILTFYVDYTFTVTKYSQDVYTREIMRNFWAIFVNAEDSYREIRDTLIANGISSEIDRYILSGYCKMDLYNQSTIVKRTRKCVILAPHHTILEWKDGLEIGGFLDYAETMQELPLRYSDIDFIFRPHPLLFVHLRRDDIWGQSKTDTYLDRLLANSNVKFSDEPEYFSIFANSDALIHDCGSFAAEYLFTGKPACFLRSSRTVIEDQFNAIGQKCIRHHYLATDTGAMFDFMDQIVVNDCDPMRDDRARFVERDLSINYPHAAGAIARHIRDVLCMSES
jgi:hypothetical protein